MIYYLQSIRKEKLFLGYAIAALLVLLVGVVGVWGVSTVSDSFERVENEVVQEILILEEIKSSFTLMLLEMTTLLLLEPVEEEKEEQIELVLSHWGIFEENIIAHSSLVGVATEPLAFQGETVFGFVETILNQVREGASTEEVVPYKKKLKELEQNEIFPEIQEKIDLALAELSIERRNNTETARFVAIAVVVAGSVGVVLILFLGFLISRREALIDQFREQLISIVSHQLKAPLSVIRGHAELLLAGKIISKDDKENILIIQKSAQDMNTLVRDLLNLTQINQDKFVLKKERVNICQTVREVVDSLKTTASENDVRFVFEKPIDDIFIVTDAVKMEQVFKNIIGNGIKYNKKGGTLTIQFKTQADTVTVEIKDEGIGIPLNEQKMIFDRFYRASNARAKEHSGTGLGLFIAQAIVRQSGGDIVFTSEEGRGTTFVITLPIDKN